MRPHGTGVDVDPRSPRAQATCDRCGGHYNHWKLQFQYQWMGPKLQNLRLLVCKSCLDLPQEQLRTIVLPPDPMPIPNPRPEAYTEADNPLSGIGVHIGNMVSYGGLNAAFDGNEDKVLQQCCGTLISNSSYNTVGEQWVSGPQPVTAETQTNALAMSRFVLVAPSDQSFFYNGTLGSYEIQGSNDFCTWVTLYSSTTSGEFAERIDVSVESGTPYHFHRAAFINGFGLPIAVAQFKIYGTMMQGSTAVPATEFFATEDGSNLVTENDQFLIAECP